MKRKIVTLLAAVVMTGALLAGPALARDHDGFYTNRWHAAEVWRQHHPYQAWGNPGQGYGYPGSGYANQPGRYANEYPWNSGYRSGWQPRQAQGWFHHDRDHDGD